MLAPILSKIKNNAELAAVVSGGVGGNNSAGSAGGGNNNGINLEGDKKGGGGGGTGGEGSGGVGGVGGNEGSGHISIPIEPAKRVKVPFNYKIAVIFDKMMIPLQKCEGTVQF